MPPPYAFIPQPPGDWKDIFDNRAIEMAISHNMFIRGLNTVYFQAPKVKEDQVQAFAFFCNSFLTMIHHHHTIEEELLFPYFESKLGPGTMEHNVEQHHAFLPGLEDLETYIKDIRAGKAKYDSKVVIEKLDSFADGLVQHLRDEIPTLESSKMRAAITQKELQDLESALEKRVLHDVSLIKVLPLGLVLHDKTTAPHFPPLPAPILWITRYGLYHLHSDAWAFGPCDVYGKLKPGFGNDDPAA
ncbi:hypothetical protein Hypma_002703 [Hypsizygus marmoreus]|uniref:Hemerythrin-like domain-containing protein n=1 Tax=Hypsizygus marmoreus TaxID=39966 RepID=A0A369J3H8_HYPMA|nr:hypothetical protein Hypma_002703 [Hypsizygus marmoreus]